MYHELSFKVIENVGEIHFLKQNTFNINQSNDQLIENNQSKLSNHKE